jgi:hypothetical protein
LSSAACSIVLLCFCSALSFCSASALLYCSALPLLCSIILFFYSVFHLLCLSFSPILIYNSFHSVYQSDFILNSFSFLLSNCFVLFPFRTANPIQSHSFSFIHDSLTIPLPLPMGNPRTSVLATETLTNSSSSVRFT